jgi:hypothetical protein
LEIVTLLFSWFRNFSFCTSKAITGLDPFAAGLARERRFGDSTEIAVAAVAVDSRAPSSPTLLAPDLFCLACGTTGTAFFASTGFLISALGARVAEAFSPELLDEPAGFFSGDFIQAARLRSHSYPRRQYPQHLPPRNGKPDLPG